MLLYPGPLGVIDHRMNSRVVDRHQMHAERVLSSKSKDETKYRLRNSLA